jgi:hypothetical protein
MKLLERLPPLHYIHFIRMHQSYDDFKFFNLKIRKILMSKMSLERSQYFYLISFTVTFNSYSSNFMFERSEDASSKFSDVRALKNKWYFIIGLGINIINLSK